MTAKDVTAEILWTPFEALPEAGQAAIVARLPGDKEFVQDLIDVAFSEHARCEPGADMTIWNNNARNKT